MSIEICIHCSNPIDTDFDNDIAARICILCLRDMTLAELQKLLLQISDEFDKLLVAEIIQEKVCEK